VEEALQWNPGQHGKNREIQVNIKFSCFFPPFKYVNLLLYSLEDAAKKVSISKKSLDDYLLQLRYGKKYGFDFNEHKEAKIGILRAFVKKKKQEEKEKGKMKAGNVSE